FQAEDGIRDLIVTGVQTCALPICEYPGRGSAPSTGPLLEEDEQPRAANDEALTQSSPELSPHGYGHCSLIPRTRHERLSRIQDRSEERRVGKECRNRWERRQIRKK